MSKKHKPVIEVIILFILSSLFKIYLNKFFFKEYPSVEMLFVMVC